MQGQGAPGSRPPSSEAGNGGGGRTASGSVPSGSRQQPLTASQSPAAPAAAAQAAANLGLPAGNAIAPAPSGALSLPGQPVQQQPLAFPPTAAQPQPMQSGSAAAARVQDMGSGGVPHQHTSGADHGMRSTPKAPSSDAAVTITVNASSQPQQPLLLGPQAKQQLQSGHAQPQPQPYLQPVYPQTGGGSTYPVYAPPKPVQSTGPAPALRPPAFPVAGAAAPNSGVLMSNGAPIPPPPDWLLELTNGRTTL